MIDTNSKSWVLGLVGVAAIVALWQSPAWADLAFARSAYRSGVRGFSGRSGVTLSGGSFSVPVPGYRTVPEVEIKRGTTATIDRVKVTLTSPGSAKVNAARLTFSTPIKVKANAGPFINEMINKGGADRLSRLGAGMASLLNPRDVKLLELSFANNKGLMTIGGKISVMGMALNLPPCSGGVDSGLVQALSRRLPQMISRTSCQLRATMASGAPVALEGEAAVALNGQDRTLKLRDARLRVSGFGGLGDRPVEISGGLSARVQPDRSLKLDMSGLTIKIPGPATVGTLE